MVSRAVKISIVVAACAWLAIKTNILPPPTELLNTASEYVNTVLTTFNVKDAREAVETVNPDNPVESESMEENVGNTEISTETRNETEEVLKEITKKMFYHVADECSLNTGHCYIIQGFVRMRNNIFTASRNMVLKEMEGYVFTKVDLAIPQPLTMENKDISLWEVDKAKVTSPYCQMQIAAGFVTEALSYDSADKQQILMIGLGGGVATNFLSLLPDKGINVETTAIELDPFIVELAEKYFGHSTVPGVVNTVIADGLVFLKEAAEKGLKFRSVILDAGYNSDETKTGLLGPVKEFLADDAVKHIYDVLEEGGVVSVNTISDFNEKKHEAEALEAFKRHFPSCYLVPYVPERKMLICSKRANWTWEEQKNRFDNNLRKVVDLFNFSNLEYLLK